MELYLLWRLVRRWWYLMAIPILLATLWSVPALPSMLSPDETYGATIAFAVGAPPTDENSISAETDNNVRSGTYEDTSYVPWLASEYVVVNIPRWVTSTGFARSVSELLAQNGLEISPEDVHRGLAADGVRGTLTVYYGWDNEAELEAIALASIEVLQTQNQAIFPQLAAQPATITPLDEIDVVRTYPPLTARLAPFIRIALGLGVGIGLMFLAAYLDNRIFDIEELAYLDIPVLATIPRE